MKKLLKNIKIVTEDNFSAETNTIYFVNSQNDTGYTNGYTFFDGKKYGYGKDKELLSNKVTELTSACTHTQFPSAKIVYDTFIDNEQVTAAAINTLNTNKENLSNKVTSLSSGSTDTEYPSAKCVYDLVGNIESLLEDLL